MPPFKPYSTPWPALLLWTLIFSSILGTFDANAQLLTSTNPVYILRAEQAFQTAARNYATAPDIATNCSALGRTAFDWCQFATNDTQRADVAKLGIAAGQHLISRDPESAIGHYYLAMDYGELAAAEAPSLAAYRLVHQIEYEFEVALKLDENLDYAGPARNLGLLYRDAPGWPFSIGSKWKAREFLDRAAKTAPDYPENQLNLAETQIKWRLPDDARATLAKLDDIWTAAQTNFTGQAWEESWEDWNTRRQAAKAEYHKVFKQNP